MERVSKNCYKGDFVKSPNELMELAINKKSVYHPLWGVKPAAVIINMNFSIVMKCISKGSIFKVLKQ